MMELCNDIVVIVGYDRRISWLSNAPLGMEYDSNSIEYYSSKVHIYKTTEPLFAL